MSLKSLRLSSARSVLTYSSIPSINTYAYHTPGLVLLSEHQELTLTGNIIQFFQFPVFNNGVYNSANDSDLPNNGRIVIVDSWEKYLNVAEQFYISTIIIQNGGDIANASRLLASANGDTLAEKLASYISDPTSLLRTGDASVSGSKESGVTDKISSLFIQRFFTPINSG